MGGRKQGNSAGSLAHLNDRKESFASALALPVRATSSETESKRHFLFFLPLPSLATGRLRRSILNWRRRNGHYKHQAKRRTLSAGCGRVPYFVLLLLTDLLLPFYRSLYGSSRTSPTMNLEYTGESSLDPQKGAN